jgi:hypothetical protein
MKPINYGRPLALLLGALLFIAAHADVTIKSVDNYAGNSNVYTGSPNTTIKVIELDADKKPVRSWTGTTDGDGKLTIPAGHNLSLPYLRAENADPKSAEFVLPSSINANEPFLFTSTGTLQGEVVDIKTISGEVVATQKADNLGRVFLSAGLAAGAYILTTTHNEATKVGQVNVKGIKFDVADLKNSPSFNEDYNAIDFTKFGSLEGSFGNLNNLDLDDFVSTRTPLILAATPRQIVFSKPIDTGMNPGPHQLTVRDKATGQTATTNLLVFTANAKLTQARVASGTQTQLVISVEPKELIGQAHATIINGPVTFSNGEREMDLDVANGTATFPIQSQPGSTGSFNVDWWFKPGDHHNPPLKAHWWEPWKKSKWWLWEPKKPANGGGDTKAQPNGWKPIKVVGDDGKVVGEGMEKTEKDGDKTKTTRIVRKGDDTVEESVTVDEKTRTTDSTSTGRPNTEGVQEEVHEVKVEKKNDKGEWVVESHEKTTRKIKGDKIIDESHEWIVKPPKKKG